MQKELDVKFTLNLGLQKITLDCPICPEAAQYKDIKKHIAEMHPDYFGQEAQPSPRKNQVPQTRSSTLEEVSARTAGKGRFGQAASPCSFRKQSEAIERKGETELQRPKEQLGHGGKPLFFPSPQSCGHGSSADIDIEMLTDDNDSDTSLEEPHKESGIEAKHSEEIVKCPHCFTPLEAFELEAHQNSCPDAPFPCHVCAQSITAVAYEKHMAIHHEEQQRKVKAQTAAHNGTVAKKDIEVRNQRFKNEPMSEEEKTERLRILLTENKKCNEAYEPQRNLFSAIAGSPEETRRDVLEDTGRRKQENKPADFSAIEPMGERDDRSSGKKANKSVQTAVTEAKVSDIQEHTSDEFRKSKEVAALKNKIKELEHRLEMLETPLKALIKRLSEEQQQTRRLSTYTDL